MLGGDEEFLGGRKKRNSSTTSLLAQDTKLWIAKCDKRLIIVQTFEHLIIFSTMKAH